MPGPSVIAHRGASLYAPENTMAAFAMAVQQGADAIELDTKLCATGEVVVIHDETVDRTTLGSGRVNKMTLAELRELDAGSFFDTEFRGEKIPTLNEVFEVFGKKIKINVELTNIGAPFDYLPFKVCELIKHHNLFGQVFLSSYLPWTLARAYKSAPNVPVCLITLKGMGKGWLAQTVSRMIHSTAVHPEYRDVDRDFIDRAHRRGYYVNTWVVNDPEVMQRLIVDGVDGLISDDPVLAIKVRSRIKNANTSSG